MKYKLLFSFIASTLLFFGLSPFNSYADDISVTGNGSESQSAVQSSADTTTTIAQNNSGSITNNVNSSSDTGNNTASNNTGNATITTGDATTQTKVDNQLNSSTVSQDCCNRSDSGSVTITGNGTGSSNTAAVNSSTTTTAIVNQNATINNSITLSANIGNNTASGNLGNVRIKTGNIAAYQSIVNGPVNFASVSLPSSPNDTTVKISGNGSFSDNTVNIHHRNDTNVYVNNNAYFLNDVTLRLNTGGNTADVNVGNVDIKTGEIIAVTEIKNVANISKVEITCCQPEKPHENQPSAPAPSTPTTITTNTTTSGGSTQPANGQVLAAAVGKVLPATGNYWMVLFLLGNILMLFMGAFLRLRSGRSPGYAVAL